LSEVAQLRQKIADAYLAARNGLSGLAVGIPKHQFITQRMENMGKYQAELEATVGQQTAAQVMAETLGAL
jgi:hypothetical protein